MKELLRTGLMAFAALALTAGLTAQEYAYTPLEIPLQEGVNIEQVKDAGQECVAEVMAEFVKQKAGEDLKLFQVLPFGGDVDGSYLTSQLQNQFAAKGRSVGYERYTRNEGAFNQILKEIGWGDKYGDIMDPVTVQKFGKLSGVQGLIVPRLSLTTIDGVTTLRVSLQGYKVETGKALPFAHEAKRTITPPAPPAAPPEPVNYFKWLIPIVILLIIVWVIAKFLKTLSRPR